MDEFRNEVQDILDRVDLTSALDILIIAGIIYWVLVILKGTAAIVLLRGAAILLLGGVLLAQGLDLEVLDFVIRNSFIGLLIAIPIIFQPEIRRALERVGRTGVRVWARPSYDGVIEAVAESTSALAKLRHGALIVLERDTGLQDIIDTGVALNADPSAELLEGIFFPNAPLHDGAVILRDHEVAAACCTLPLSETRLPAELGLRHRAGLGVTEATDAVSIMVSEETGAISLAAEGRLYPRLDDARLRGLLMRLLGARGNGASPGVTPP
jgi:diadenylate cyclase